LLKILLLVNYKKLPMKKIFFVLLLLVLGGAFYFYQVNNKSYTLAEVQAHATKDDCWLAIEGKVYNVTPMTSSGKHPGGEAILQGCGKDATALFNTRPMGSGTPHSDKARGNLAIFGIGNLSK
jgi:cytochrome b involved in lipid metabolism